MMDAKHIAESLGVEMEFRMTLSPSPSSTPLDSPNQTFGETVLPHDMCQAEIDADVMSDTDARHTTSHPPLRDAQADLSTQITPEMKAQPQETRRWRWTIKKAQKRTKAWNQLEQMEKWKATCRQPNRRGCAANFIVNKIINLFMNSVIIWVGWTDVDLSVVVQVVIQVDECFSESGSGDA
ncbi:unnamed protein product [Mesocestoides corti]|uniref:Uncharacterized protein n=1 Tax=Mesocestoides corti TaxID=53468 RepID=A0A0R3ULZ0_MESCO|nr:unnamed protein product [Mesocestoides corti]